MLSTTLERPTIVAVPLSVPEEDSLISLSASIEKPARVHSGQVRVGSTARFQSSRGWAFSGSID